MTDNTINNDVTMGGATGTLLAGRYRVVRPLGQGGMGSVWLAEDTKLDGFKVAIKMLPSVLISNKRALRQVKHEALVSLRLSHPNIATVRAFEDENGNPFLVMDYIEGRTLDDYLDEKGKLTEDETIQILKPVAAALDYAHSQGVVHRDVKPGNIMIRKDGTPFVLDFGIAREIQETMTRVTGKLSSGTLLYMSPEQVRGLPPTAAQDIYSLAAVAYECLVGQAPFCRGQIEYQILNEPVVPLPESFRLARRIGGSLQKDPQLRSGKCQQIFDCDMPAGEPKKASCNKGVGAHKASRFVACDDPRKELLAASNADESQDRDKGKGDDATTSSGWLVVSLVLIVGIVLFVSLAKKENSTLGGRCWEYLRELAQGRCLHVVQ